MNERITGNDNFTDIVMKMSEGNPRAVTVLARLFKETPRIDPMNLMGGFGPILNLDSLNIYGSRIWMFYKDICKESLPKMIACLRGWQLGFITSKQLNYAIDNYGEDLDLNAVTHQVTTQILLNMEETKEIKI